LFKDWAKAVSDAFAALGWVQTGDTGQVVWTATVLTFTQVTVGATAVYSYLSYTGPAPRIGMSVIVSGFGTAGNNLNPGILTAVSGGAAGTVSMAVTTQADETHAGSGTTTALASPPGTSAYVYEIWGMGDALQATSPFYLKLECGTGGAANYPNIYFTIGTGVNGAGSLSGNTGTRTTLKGSTSTGGGATLYECNFCGSSDYFGMMLWRLAGTAHVSVLCMERSKDSFGANTGDYLTINSASYNANTQQTVFKVGLGTNTTLETGTTGRWATILPITSTTGSQNNKTHVSPVYPLVGQVTYPSIMAMVVLSADLVEGSVFTVQIYGTNHNYLFTKSNYCAVGNQSVGWPAIRWE
jgi:hypothetical protein